MKIKWDVVCLCVASVAFFSVIVTQFSETIPEEVYSMIYIFPLLGVAIISFTLSKKYRKIKEFCLGHSVLGAAMVFYIIAEVCWIVLGWYDYTQYPSVYDIFFALFSIFAIIHPLVIMRFFQIKPKRNHMILLVGIITSVLILYVAVVGEIKDPQSYYTGLAFMGLSSTLLAVSIVTILSLRGRQIFRVWILIGIAFLINCIADFHYYIMENFKDWTIGDWENIGWFIANIILLYAVIEHKNKYRVLQE